MGNQHWALDPSQLLLFHSLQWSSGMAQTQSHCLLLPVLALPCWLLALLLLAAPRLCQAGPQGQVRGVPLVHELLSWGYPMLESSQCLALGLQGVLLPQEHQLLFPMAVTLQRMETQVLPGQH